MNWTGEFWRTSSRSVQSAAVYRAALIGMRSHTTWKAVTFTVSCQSPDRDQLLQPAQPFRPRRAGVHPDRTHPDCRLGTLLRSARSRGTSPPSSPSSACPDRHREPPGPRRPRLPRRLRRATGSPPRTMNRVPSASPPPWEPHRPACERGAPGTGIRPPLGAAELRAGQASATPPPEFETTDPTSLSWQGRPASRHSASVK